MTRAFSNTKTISLGENSLPDHYPAWEKGISLTPVPLAFLIYLKGKRKLRNACEGHIPRTQSKGHILEDCIPKIPGKRMTFNHKIIKYFHPCSLLPYQQGFRVITVDYSWKCCKMWSLLKGAHRKAQRQQGRQILKEMKSLVPQPTINI